ncbi:hypothetical protein FBU30_005150 [Linnemannia zychae]|nr:hypothetical protein FBU30_005150 [Linnemannia zychae]
MSPLLTIGAYTGNTTTPASGYSIVFDQAGGGSIYPATGVDTSQIANSNEVLRLGPSQPIDMSGIVTTSKAIAVNVDEVAYIIDQEPNGSLVMYNINPSRSSLLQRVPMGGNVPSFGQSMTAAGSVSNIALYSIVDGSARISVYNIPGQTWTGSTPISTNSSSPSSLPTSNGNTSTSSPAPLGAIIGGAIGGIVLIALVLFFVFRRNRKGLKKVDSSDELTKGIIYHDHKMPMLAEGYVVQQPYVTYAPFPQDSATYNLPIQQFQPVSATALIGAGDSYIPQPIGTMSGPYLHPYTYSPPVVTVSQSPPAVLTAQTIQTPEGSVSVEGSPLRAYESTPKMRGSPQSTVTSTDTPADTFMNAPRNPQMHE